MKAVATLWDSHFKSGVARNHDQILQLGHLNNHVAQVAFVPSLRVMREMLPDFKDF